MKKILRPIGVAAALSVGAFLLSGTAQAQGFSGPSATCNATSNHFFGPLFSDARVFSTGLNTTVTQDLVAPISAGTYDLTTVAWDGANTRVAQGVQPFEIYFIQLLDAADNVLATSGVSTDLEDLVKEAEWAGSIGQITWAGADATKVRVVHGKFGFPDLQSVHAICFGWSPAQVVTTTTSTTTTTIPTTTTSAPVDPTTTIPTTTTSAPVDPTTTTTTTTVVPTVVLPEVEESQPADPVQGDPTFTG